MATANLHCQKLTTAQLCFPISTLRLKLLLQPLWEHAQLRQAWARHSLLPNWLINAPSA